MKRSIKKKHIRSMLFLILSLPLVLFFQNCSAAKVETGTSSESTEGTVSGKLWSDPKSWSSGKVPVANEDVTIPEGTILKLDVDTASLGTLNINGTLNFAEKNLTLTAATINVNGTLQIGSPEKLFTNKAIITLTGAATGSFSRGIMAHGKLLLYGASPNKAWTQLGAHAPANTTSIKLKESVNWKVGDRIVIAPTEFWPTTSNATANQDELTYGPNMTELRTITTNTGDTLNFDSGLFNFHFGLLQYVTNSGMSFIRDFSFIPPAEPFNPVLDERAEVANLTRNIVIQSIDDDAWKNSGFGANVMMMMLTSKANIDGVEFRRVGQAGKTGRYPFHWHMLSYDQNNGNFLGDATGHYVKNSTISNSMNRCLVIHGTNGVLVQNNICYDIKGHALFLEDAAERRNTIEGNLALKIRNPDPSKVLLVHEGTSGFTGPSGFWITNPDNIVRNNSAADAAGPGFWLSYPNKPLRLSKLVPISPDNMKHSIFQYNTAHSNKGSGVLLEAIEIDDAGNIALNKYAPTSDEQENRYENLIPRFELKGVVSYKNLGGGYRNRATKPDYVEWTVADNFGLSFSGQVDDGNLFRALVVGTSLNNLKPYPINLWPGEPPAAFASYHSTLHFVDNVAVNFPVVIDKRSGVFQTDDYYIAAVDKGPVRNSGNRLINSDAGFRWLPVEYRASNPNNEHWTLAGALWDPHGYWGPKGNYWVFDMPFLTVGANCVSVAPVGQNHKSCDGEYYGIQNFYIDSETDLYLFRAPILATRLDSNLQPIGTFSVGDGTTGSVLLTNMRHFAARPGAEYTLTFPGRALSKETYFDITNAYRSSDHFLIGVAYGGRDIPEVYITNGNRQGQYTQSPGTPYRTDVVAAASLAEVRAATTPKYFVDRARSLIWIKYRGGLLTPNIYDANPTGDTVLYQRHSIGIKGM